MRTKKLPAVINTAMKETIGLTGKGAVFVRAFMETFEPNVSLRECQDAGRVAVEELGEDISVAYISNLARKLTIHHIVDKRKEGRKYFLIRSDHTNDFLDWLQDNPRWGVDLNLDGLVEVEQRDELLNFLDERHSVLISAKHPLPKAQYRLLMKQFSEGKLDMAFVHTGLPMGVKVEGKTVRVKEML